MQYLNGDLARLQVEQDDIKRKQQLGQTLQQAGLNPVQGGNSVLALLAALTSTIRGNSLMKDASKSMSENLASQFDAQNQADQAKAEAEQKRREEDWQRKLQEIEYANKSAAQYRAPSNIDPNSPEGIKARLQFEKGKAGLQPKAAGPAAPEFQRKIEALVAAGMPVADATKAVVLGAGGGGGEKVGPIPSGMRLNAQGSLERIPGAPGEETVVDPRKELAHDALRYVSAITGKSMEALQGATPEQVASFVKSSSPALSGPLLGNLPYAGINTEAILKKMAANQARINNPKGTVTDPDFRAAEQSLPAMSRPANVNAELIQNILSGAGGQGAPPSGAQQEFPDGTVIQNAQGQKMVMQAGQWVPQ